MQPIKYNRDIYSQLSIIESFKNIRISWVPWSSILSKKFGNDIEETFQIGLGLWWDKKAGKREKCKVMRLHSAFSWGWANSRWWHAWWETRNEADMVGSLRLYQNLFCRKSRVRKGFSVRKWLKSQCFRNWNSNWRTN